MRTTGKFYPTLMLRKFYPTVMFAILLIVLFAGCASTETHSGTGEYLDDTVITTKVKTAIFNDSALKSSEINVETFKGVVQLSGFVSSRSDIETATRLAREVKGVKSVTNNMQLK